MQNTIAKRPPAVFFKLKTDHWTQPFWSAAAERRLTVPRCKDCGRFRMPPTPFCPQCQSQRVLSYELTGAGTIYSYTIVWRAVLQEMQASIPYVPAVIELAGADGLRVISNIVDVPVDMISVGALVKLVWDEQDGVGIPRFTLNE